MAKSPRELYLASLGGAQPQTQGNTYSTGQVTTAQQLGMAPADLVNSGLWNLLVNISGARDIGNFAQHPGIGTGLNAAMAIPLPWLKAGKLAEAVGQISEREAPNLLRILARAKEGEALKLGEGLERSHIKTAAKVGHRSANIAGNAAAINNVAQDPSRTNALTALGLMLPVPEKGLKRHISQGVKGLSAANVVLQSGTVGSAANALGSSPLRAEQDAALLERLLGTRERAEAGHKTLVPEAEHEGHDLLSPVQRLLIRIFSAGVSPFQLPAHAGG